MNVLIIDDETGLRRGIAKRLSIEGYILYDASNTAEAMQIIRNEQIHIILLDLRLGEEDGYQFLKQLKAREPEIRVIIITGYGTIKSSVACIKEGASNYLTKPIDMDILISTIGSEAEKISLYEENISLRQSINDLTSKNNMTSMSESFPSHIDTVINKIKDSRVSILITGETGTGKEVTARRIHFSGSFSQKPFIGLNCSAFNRNLIESELFGHEKGAFTGAGSRKLGRFEIVRDGSLFLDEIGDMDLGMQVKLLRVLEEKVFERVGGTQKIKTNCRIIAATHKNLKQAIKDHSFREDLYYRLNVIEINLPPLNKRTEEIPFLVDQFIDSANIEFEKNIKTIDSNLMDQLKNYSWPGNIRQLKNVITNAVILSDSDTIKSLSIPDFDSNLSLKGDSSSLNLKVLLETETGNIERKVIGKVLEEEKRNITNSALRLGISRKTLYKKIESYNL
jgi:DNA-binding NtrC family response regulator